MKPRRRQRLTSQEALGVTIAVLGASNVVTNVWLPAAAYVPWNLALAGGLVAVVRSSGCEAAELGVDPHHLRRSAQIGVVGAGIVACGYGFALLTGVGADVFRDERVTSLSTPAMMGTVLGRIPLGTVLTEEAIFRGVLPAVLTSYHRRRLPPGVTSSLLFGLWHVLPSLELPTANAAVRRVVGETAPLRVAAAAVASTTVAGLVLHSLRQRTQHLAAPVMVHLAVNVLGVLGVRFAWSRRTKGPNSLGL
jgi:membrane protease YdiL (CAAX protease family)